MTDELYLEHIIDHWKHPRNFGNLKKFDVSHKESNPLCGDEINVQIKFNKNRIEGIKFTGNGCTISQASASIVTESVKNKTLEEVKNITAEKLIKMLGIEISPTRLKCALLPLEAIKNGIKMHESRKK